MFKKAECEVIFQNQEMSGAERHRFEFFRAFVQNGSGDMLAVWKLGRLGGLLPHLTGLPDRLGKFGGRVPATLGKDRHNHGGQTAGL
jgi:hypothetical protein